MGGSGGHMRHPHDLDEVSTGEDIIQLFRAIPDYLRSEEFAGGRVASLKLDGSNNAIKVVRRGTDDIEFAVDRASQSPLDVNGVTLDKIKQRFTKVMKSGEVKFNAGLARSSAGLISMLDRTYRANPKKVHTLLENLGLIGADGEPDPTKFINIEYIERKSDDIDQETGMGRANAIYYSFDSITFLNISQYYEVIRKGEIRRPGAERPVVTDYNEQGEKIEKISTDVSVALNFNPQDLDTLAAMAQTYAPMNSADEQFSVLGPGDLGVQVDHDSPEGSSEEEIAMATEKAIVQLEGAIEKTLESDLTFVIDDQTAISRPLIEWLKIAINFPYKPDITLVDGSRKGPFTKDLHNQLVDMQTPLAEIIPIDEGGCVFDGSLSDCEKAIYGATFYEAARRLGNAVKQVLQSKYDRFGSTVDQEGVVINAGMPFGEKTTSNTFKLTGEFIVDGSHGVYAVREQVQDLSQPFSVKISKDTTLTKTLQEWMMDAIKNKHVYQKLPSFVYEDILSGKSIVDIVEQQNAEETIYNAVYGYIDCLLEKKGDFMKDKHNSDPFPAPIPRLGEQDEVEDEDADPVGPIGGGITYAVVPGSYKPPTLGHIGMIAQYSAMVDKLAGENGKVLVLISEPKKPKNERPLPGGKVLKKADVEKILDIYNLKQYANVEVVPVETASPMTAVYDFVSPKLNNIQAGDRVILGASTKGGDSDRWNDIIMNSEKHVMPGVQVDNIPIDPTEHSDEYIELLYENPDILRELPSYKKATDGSLLRNISASDSRYLMSYLGGPRHDVAMQLLSSFFGHKTAEILGFLGLPTKQQSDLEELTSMAGGANAGPGAATRDPLSLSSRKKKPRNLEESTSINIIEEVIELIMEKGVI